MPAGSERAANGEGFLTRTDLRDLGLSRRAIDAIFRALPTVVLPEFSRPLIRAADFRDFIETHTYRGDRVVPTRSTGRVWERVRPDVR